MLFYINTQLMVEFSDLSLIFSIQMPDNNINSVFPRILI